MYGPPLCRKRKTKVTGWSAQMYSAFVEHKLLALDGMRCALVLLSNAALEGIFRFTGFESAGFRPLCHLIVRQQTWQKIIHSVVAAGL
jgi:hypothetical protein